jgi:hypothetical protein
MSGSVPIPSNILPFFWKETIVLIFPRNSELGNSNLSLFPLEPSVFIPTIFMFGKSLNTETKTDAALKLLSFASIYIGLL